MRSPTLTIDPALGPPPLAAALVWGLGLPGCPATETPPAYLADLLAHVRRVGEGFLSPSRKASVRNLLRRGSYKPAGRAKPSSEYLLAAALGDFPLVNPAVDVNNAVSLQWGYPASIFDLAKTGDELFLRLGLAGESYIFNASGQTIELRDLLVLCRRRGAGPAPSALSGGSLRGGAEPGGHDSSPDAPAAASGGGAPDDAQRGALGRSPVEGGTPAGAALAGGAWEPCGNPVKDAMATKVLSDTTEVVAVVYAPGEDAAGPLRDCAERYVALLEEACAAAETGFVVVGA